MYMLVLNFTGIVNKSKFMDKNVCGAFSYLLIQIGALFEKIDFTRLRRFCMLRGFSTPPDFQQKIKSAEELDDILDVFDNTVYGNWLNVRLLKRIVENIDDQQAEEAIKFYEECVYSRKASDVKQYLSALKGCDERILSKIETKINENHEDLTVRQIIDWCGGLEVIMNIFPGGVSVTNFGNPGCLKITFSIPLYCSLHAYEMVKKRFYKLRQFHIQYLEIDSFTKVFALNCSDNENALRRLSLDVPKCKFVILILY